MLFRADGGHSYIESYMSPSIGDDGGCEGCGPFVAGLKKLYTSKIRPGVAPKRADPKLAPRHFFDWTVKDRSPSFPALSRSARSGCRCCKLLKSTITGSRGSIGADNASRVSFRFSCIANARMRAGGMPFKEVQEFSIGTTTPAGRADSKKSLGTIHVLRSDDFDPLSVDNAKMIRGAIESCVNAHDSCPGLEQTSCPLRLLNVLDGDRVRLETMKPGRRRRPVAYAALSYCWGASEAMKFARTMANNLAERTEGFSPELLPKTLQDAIWVARLLNIQYLWIDALCIVQDCRKEWTTEAQKMMEYYGHARVTIVPVEADSADSGMRTGHEQPISCRLRGPWKNDCGSDLILSNRPPGSRKSISHSPWNRRGWTFQESLNSARILYVFGHNVALECREGSWDTLVGWCPHKREDWSRFLPTDSAEPELPQSLDRLNRDWCWLVQCYTERRLSNPRDQWFAFCGIADAFSKASGRETIAGLWKDRILEDIVSWRWRRKSPKKSPLLPRHDSLHNHQPNPSSDRCSHCGTLECSTPYSDEAGSNRARFPSWTWLGASWSDSAGGIPLSKTAIERLDDGLCSKLVSVKADDGILQAPKLELCGPVLPKEATLRIIAKARDLALRLQGLGAKDSGIVYLDDVDGKGFACCCRKPHTTRDCSSHGAILEMTLPVSALLIGTARFQAALGQSYRHFLLIQPTSRMVGGIEDDVEYRRVGTMHAAEEELGAVVERELKGREKKRIILV